MYRSSDSNKNVDIKFSALHQVRSSYFFFKKEEWWISLTTSRLYLYTTMALMKSEYP